MEKMIIRLAEPADIPCILDLVRELAVYEQLEDQVVATEALFREWMFEKRIAEAILAVVDGKPVGLALFFHNFSTFLGRGGIYLEDLYVQPAYRGRGYGKALLKTLAQFAVERGCGRVEWCCLNWNQPSINFYRSLGAVPMEDWTIYRLTGSSLENMAK